MRDPERIDRITELLRQLWHKYPDWRLGQLISNLMGPGLQDVFYVEDTPRQEGESPWTGPLDRRNWEDLIKEELNK